MSTWLDLVDGLASLSSEAIITTIHIPGNFTVASTAMASRPWGGARSIISSINQSSNSSGRGTDCIRENLSKVFSNRSADKARKLTGRYLGKGFFSLGHISRKGMRFFTSLETSFMIKFCNARFEIGARKCSGARYLSAGTGTENLLRWKGGLVMNVVLGRLDRSGSVGTCSTQQGYCVD